MTKTPRTNHRALPTKSSQQSEYQANKPRNTRVRRGELYKGNFREQTLWENIGNDITFRPQCPESLPKVDRESFGKTGGQSQKDGCQKKDNVSPFLGAKERGKGEGGIVNVIGAWSSSSSSSFQSAVSLLRASCSKLILGLCTNSKHGEGRTRPDWPRPDQTDPPPKKKTQKLLRYCAGKRAPEAREKGKTKDAVPTRLALCTTMCLCNALVAWSCTSRCQAKLNKAGVSSGLPERFPWLLTRGVGATTRMGYPASRPSSVWECGRKQKQGEGRSKTRDKKNQASNAATQTKTAQVSEETAVRGTNKGKTELPNNQSKQQKRHNANEANEKHNTTKRQNTNKKIKTKRTNGREKTVCVCMPTCYLLFVS